MARPPHLALAVAALSAVVVLLRSLHAFDALRGTVDLVSLTYVGQIAWSLVAVVGFAAVGYAYATRAAAGAGDTHAAAGPRDTRTSASPGDTLVVAAIAALVGVLAGNLALVLSTEVSWGLSLPAVLALVGTNAVLDAATFGLLTLGGFALGAHETP